MKSPKMPAAPAIPPPPAAPPSIDQAQADVDAADIQRMRRGRAADILAPIGSSANTAATSGAKTLTG